MPIGVESIVGEVGSLSFVRLHTAGIDCFQRYFVDFPERHARSTALVALILYCNYSSSAQVERFGVYLLLTAIDRVENLKAVFFC